MAIAERLTGAATMEKAMADDKIEAEKREGLKILPYCGKGNGERAERQIAWVVSLGWIRVEDLGRLGLHRRFELDRRRLLLRGIDLRKT